MSKRTFGALGIAVAVSCHMLNLLAETASTRSLFYEATAASSTGHGLYFVELVD